MITNPFLVTKAEEFNSSYDLLASLMHFKTGTADVLLNRSNVFIEGSRGSGKSMYLRLMSLPIKSTYEQLARENKVEPLPSHSPYLGVYIKLVPTVFGPSEFEDSPNFRGMFQQLFNIYCTEQIVITLIDATKMSILEFDREDERRLCSGIAEAILEKGNNPVSLGALRSDLRAERKRTIQAINTPPFSPDQRSQQDTLWEMGEGVVNRVQFAGQRIHLLIDEYDSLDEFQQKIINRYLRRRDFPITFKIACKKHKLILTDVHNQPFNPSGDFSSVQLDDDEFGNGRDYRSYLASIADKRLRNAGFESDIRSLLGSKQASSKAKVARRYSGFEMVAMLSSGVVRTFLELCRDMFSRIPAGGPSRNFVVDRVIQNQVVEEHATKRWNALSRDQSARPELQVLVDRTAKLFGEKSKGTENQIIRLEVLDPERLSTFVKNLLDQAMEYEAFVQPNRERIQKNQNHPSRGYLLHRLLCIHFRLEPSSRWDVEISSDQLEKLILQPPSVIKDVARHPTAIRDSTRRMLTLAQARPCPVLEQPCPGGLPHPNVGFLACRLPESGHIRDAVRMIREVFSGFQHPSGKSFEIKTAENYPPVGDIACKVCTALTGSEFFLAEFSGFSPSVAKELGMAVARQIPTFILFNRDEQPEVGEPWSSIEYLHYALAPGSIEQMIGERIVPYLRVDLNTRPIIRLGPSEPPIDEGEGVFISLPGTAYHQETVLPKLKNLLTGAGVGPVISEQEGLALQDLDRAVSNIAKSRYCLIDTTFGAPTRAFYMGVALGYRKPFGNLIDRDNDPSDAVFTDARSKAEIEYRDTDELINELTKVFSRYGVNL